MSFLQIKKFISWILLFLLLTLPVFFLPITRNFFDTAKWMLLTITTLCFLIVWAGRLLITKKSYVGWSGPIIGLGFITVANFVSLTFCSFNKMESLLAPLGPITWIAVTLLCFFGSGLWDMRQKILLRLGLVLVAGIVGLFTIYQQVGIASFIFPADSTFTDPSFTPLGSSAGLLIFFILILPITISIALHAIKQRNEAIAAVAVVIGALTLGGFGIALWNIIPTISTTFLPLSTGVQLLIASWDTPLHALLGQGPEMFFDVFTRMKPQALNTTPLWNVGFTANASLVLHIGVTCGLVGIAACIGFLILLINAWRRYPVGFIQAILITLLWLFAPPTLILVIIPILLIFSDQEEHIIRTTLPPVSAFFISICMFAISLIAFYGIIRWYQGEYLLYRSIQTAEQGNGTETFMLQEQAIATNPMNPIFHMALSQTSLMLAQGITSASTSRTDDIPMTEEEKTLLTNLVNRSIQEAKRAVTLAPTSVNAWLNLARVYHGLIGIAGDAGNWALASYQKTVTVDPTNPILFMDIGELFMTLGKPEDAGHVYIKAIILKPNYITAWYNLANIFRQLKDWDMAIQTLEQTKGLTAVGSTDERTIDQDIILLTQKKKDDPAIPIPHTLYVPQLALPAQTQ